jgi:PIN domain nuclease of toxin-antitoxin system
MNLLLDTHTLLWSLFDHNQLSKTAYENIINTDNVVNVSVISFWEIAIKYNIGKLSLKNVLPDELPSYTEKAGFEILEITPSEVSTFYKLPKIKHKDPFDRLIIWQCIKNNITMITKDEEISEYLEYGLRTIW